MVPSSLVALVARCQRGRRPCAAERPRTSCCACVHVATGGGAQHERFHRGRRGGSTRQRIAIQWEGINEYTCLGPKGSKRRKRFLLVPTLSWRATALFLNREAAQGRPRSRVPARRQRAVDRLRHHARRELHDAGVRLGRSGTTNANYLFNADRTVNTSVVNSANSTGFTAAAFQRDFGLKVSGCRQLQPHLHPTPRRVRSAPTTARRSRPGSKDTLDIRGLAVQQGQQRQQQDRHHERVRGAVHRGRRRRPDPVLRAGEEQGQRQQQRRLLVPPGHGELLVDRRRGRFRRRTCRSATSSSCRRSPTAAASATSTPTAGTAPPAASTTRITPPRATACRSAAVATARPTPVATKSVRRRTRAQSQENDDITTRVAHRECAQRVGHTVVPPDFFEGGINLTRRSRASARCHRASARSSPTRARRRR